MAEIVAEVVDKVLEGLVLLDRFWCPSEADPQHHEVSAPRQLGSHAMITRQQRRLLDSAPQRLEKHATMVRQRRCRCLFEARVFVL